MGKHKKWQDNQPTKKYESKTNVFCYGTLNLHPVQQHLWGEAMSGVVTTLPDYELHSYDSNIFYVVKKFGETVAGKVYALTDEQLQATDRYEGAWYKREQIKVGDKIVYVYVQNKELFDEHRKAQEEAKNEVSGKDTKADKE